MDIYFTPQRHHPCSLLHLLILIILILILLLLLLLPILDGSANTT
jgi:hypothetical protein